MAPHVLTALAAMGFLKQRPKDGQGREQQDPEKGAATSDRSSRTPPEDGEDGEVDNNMDEDDDDVHVPDDDDDDDDEVHDDRPFNRTLTQETSDTFTFVRPSLPRWLTWFKDIFFADNDDRAYIPSYRTTPILSSVLIPFAILLEIPGLTEHWYVRKQGMTVVESRANSTLLNVVLALSMACAVVANVALVTRLFERRIAAMTILSIAFLSLHDIINIVVIIVFGVQHRFNDGFTYGEAYWMTVCSTVISIITNFTLVWDIIKTPNFEKSGSGLTRKQRSLSIISIVFLSYAALGALLNSLMMSLSFIDGLYFTIITTLTVGFGDVIPSTTIQRIVVCFYAAFGIVILGSGVRLIGEAVIEGMEIGYRMRLREYKKRKKLRHNQVKAAARWRDDVEDRLRASGREVWIAADPMAMAEKVNDELKALSTTPMRPKDEQMLSREGLVLNFHALPLQQLEEAARAAGLSVDSLVSRIHRPGSGTPPSGESTERMSSHRRLHEKEGARKGRAHSSQWWARSMFWLAKAKNAEEEYAKQGPSMDVVAETFKALEMDERRSLYIKLGMAWSLFFVFWMIGSVIFSQTEGWTYGEAMYFCFITFTTVGYGDYSPATSLGRSIFVFWAIMGVGAMTILIAVISDAFSSKYRSVTHSKTFDTAVRRYRAKIPKRKQRQSRGKGNKLPPALRENLERLAGETSQRPPPSLGTSAPRSPEEVEKRAREACEALPALLLEEVHRFREHIRYFLVSNGHADGLSRIPDAREEDSRGQGVGGVHLSVEGKVPASLRLLLDEIAGGQAVEGEEGMGERLKDEVWQDEHARNTLVVLSFEKGIRKMIDSAEGVLEALAERDRIAREDGNLNEHGRNIDPGPSRMS
ncbi:hypothetical protein OF83DRAFT_1173241 [Amylostereum chailletii]|nr:hypothetical protein OF83DRAFT_1173241 [Amylostereum chailletii]